MAALPSRAKPWPEKWKRNRSSGRTLLARESRSELSGIQMQEEIRVAQTTSQRRLLQEDLQTERERVQIAREKLRLSQDYERDQLEAETPVRMLKIEKEGELLRKEMVALEQTPQVAEALAEMFRGMQVSVYGQDAGLLGALTPVVDLLAGRIREMQQKAQG